MFALPYWTVSDVVKSEQRRCRYWYENCLQMLLSRQSFWHRLMVSTLEAAYRGRPIGLCECRKHDGVHGLTLA